MTTSISPAPRMVGYNLKLFGGLPCFAGVYPSAQIGASAAKYWNEELAKSVMGNPIAGTIKVIPRIPPALFNVGPVEESWDCGSSDESRYVASISDDDTYCGQTLRERYTMKPKWWKALLTAKSFANSIFALVGVCLAIPGAIQLWKTPNHQIISLASACGFLGGVSLFLSVAISIACEIVEFAVDRVLLWWVHRPIGAKR